MKYIFILLLTGCTYPKYSCDLCESRLTEMQAENAKLKNDIKNWTAIVENYKTK